MYHLTTILDKVATELEARGLRKLAAEVDVVTNTLEKKAVYNVNGPGRSPDEIKQDFAVKAVDAIDYALKQTSSYSVADQRTPIIRFLDELYTPVSMAHGAVGFDLFMEVLAEDLAERLKRKDGPLSKYLGILANSKESGRNYPKEQEEITRLLRKLKLQDTEAAKILLAPAKPAASDLLANAPVPGRMYTAFQVKAMLDGGALGDEPNLVINDISDDPAVNPNWVSKLPHDAKLKFLYTSSEKIPVFELMDKNLAHLVVKK